MLFGMNNEHATRPDGWMTCTAYAARRGVAKSTLSEAIAAGRLVASVHRDARGRPFITDPDLADREWAANTDLSEAPKAVIARAAARAAPALDVVEVLGPSPEPPAGTDAPQPALGDLQANNAAKAYWQAKRAELDYREAAGELVPARDVKARLQDVFRRCRTKLLGVPARARQTLPDLTTAHIARLDELVREALEDLAAEGKAP